MSKRAESDDAANERPSWRSSVAAHVVSAVVAAALAFAFDTFLRIRALGEGSLGLTFGRRLAAYAHAFALVAPVALVYALSLAALESFAPDAARRTRRLLSLRTLARRSPSAFADGVLFVVALGTSAYAVTCVARWFLDTLHSRVLIAVGVGVLGPLAATVVVRSVATLRPVVERMARGLDGAASPLVFVVLVVELVVVALFRLAETEPMLDRAIAWTLVRVVGVFVVTELLLASSLPRGAPRDTGVRRIAVASFVLVTLGTTLSVASYGRTTSQRDFVEAISYSGRFAHRAWSEILDRDGDGYPALLGGRDCDDRRADVHPGALDPEGDRVDSDCFGGDGTPRFDDREPIRYATSAGHTVPPNVLLVSVDTMRPDRLALFGETRHVAARLDALARESVVFTHATAASPRTTHSMAAVFTGQYPGALSYDRSHGQLDVATSATTLAEMLSSRYEAAAVLGTSRFRETPKLLQGFAFVDHAAENKTAPDWTTNHAITWLTAGRATAKPFFLWAHYVAPHEPYLADDYPSRFGDAPEGRYDTEIARADQAIGRLLDVLTAQGLANDTLVVVLSDHGESLGERGVWGHGTRLTEEQVRSVFMVRARGFAPRVVATPVALFDLLPTILDLTGTDVPTRFSARDLVPLMRGSTEGFVDRPIFAEIVPDAIHAIDTQSVRIGDEKLTFHPRTGRMTLFDLGLDPTESYDLADSRRARAEALRRTLLSWDVAFHQNDNRVAQRISEAHVDSLPASATRIDARFSNGVTLVGATIHSHEILVGSVLRVDLYFRAERPIPLDHFIQLELVPAEPTASEGILVAHHTAVDGSFPTTLWRPGRLFRDSVEIVVPSRARRGEPYVGKLEIWRDFHERSPASVEVDGTRADSVRFGRFVVR